MFETTHLFEARTGGYRTYRVPGILATEQGTVLATAEARPGGGGDWDQNDLIMRRSVDDCRTWPVSKVLETGPSGYSDLAQGPAGSIYCIHDDQIVDRMCDDRYITVRRFDLNWIQART